MKNVAVVPLRIFFRQFIVHDHFGVTALEQAAHEGDAADVGLVDLQA